MFIEKPSPAKLFLLFLFFFFFFLVLFSYFCCCCSFSSCSNPAGRMKRFLLVGISHTRIRRFPRRSSMVRSLVIRTGKHPPAFYYSTNVPSFVSKLDSVITIMNCFFRLFIQMKKKTRSKIIFHLISNVLSQV